MEALILSCGTGGGHNAAARAVAEDLMRRGHGVTVLAPYSLAGERVARNVGGAYVRLVQAAPPVFGAVYQLGNAYRHLPFRSPVYWANGLMRTHMAAYLEAHPTDVIAATHMFPMQILAHVPDHPKAMYIATDYTCIPNSEESPSDA